MKKYKSALLPPSRRLGFLCVFFPLSAFNQDCTKPTELIFMKFSGRVEQGPKKNLVNFKADLTHRADPSFGYDFTNVAKYSIQSWWTQALKNVIHIKMQ